MPTPKTQTLSVTSRTRCEIIDLTGQIERIVGESVKSGFVIIYVPHTTAGVTINENADPDVKSDFLKKLEKLVPKTEPYYEHGEGNSDSHVKTALVGNSATVLVEDGRLLLGRWQGIYFCEFDGPRRREVYVKSIDLSGGA
jgi:secondary thiamine-phosphate synthase enzyme